MIKLLHGDCLELMKDIPDGSVDMVLTDPPYGNMIGANLDGWNDNSTKWDVTIPISDMFNLLNKKVRANGVIVLFSQEPYTSQLITNSHNNLPFNYRMIWEKDHFANALLCNKAPVSYFEDLVVFTKKYDTEFNHPLREYSKKIKEFINKPKKQIFKDLGSQSICHFLRHDTNQFNLCTRETYKKLVETYNINNLEWFQDFNELDDINKKFNNLKIFNLNENKKYKSNILKYKKDYGGLHPTQKPVLLLEDLIKTYTNEGQTVLDFTMGSGSTGIACINTNRKFIGIEKDDHYFNVAKKRIEEHQLAMQLEVM